MLIAGGQMSTGPTGIAFCQKARMELAVELFMDPLHRFWNSEKLGLLQGGGYETVLPTCIPYNVNVGPWRTGGWVAQLDAQRRAHLATHVLGSCALMSSLLPLIARDLGKEDMLGSTDLELEAVRMLREDKRLTARGVGVALCRWSSWVDSHEYWSEVYHLRLLLMLLWGLACGLVPCRTHGLALTVAGVPTKVEEERKESMQTSASRSGAMQSRGALEGACAKSWLCRLPSCISSRPWSTHCRAHRG